MKDLEVLCKTMNMKEIAEHYNTYDKTVWYWLKKYNLKAVPGNKGHRKKIDIDMDRVKKMLIYGVNINDVSAMMHVCKNTIYNRLREEGLTMSDLIDKNVDASGAGVPCRHDCKYWCEKASCCDYLCMAGSRRPCPADNCTVYEKKGKGEALGKWKSKRIY